MNMMIISSAFSRTLTAIAPDSPPVTARLFSLVVELVELSAKS